MFGRGQQYLAATALDALGCERRGTPGAMAEEFRLPAVGAESTAASYEEGDL
jgi:hypothetical protein